MPGIKKLSEAKSRLRVGTLSEVKSRLRDLKVERSEIPLAGLERLKKKSESASGGRIKNSKFITRNS